jgi:NAD(P)-dependent dehydrogenase (short-subunit alcohol dehydrogenase family)
MSERYQLQRRPVSARIDETVRLDERKHSMSFDGQRVLVVGASGGIGEATAAAFRRAGASVVIAARSKQRLDEAAARIGAVAVHPVDATDAASVAAMLEAVGPLDHLVLSIGAPGLEGMGEFASMADEPLRRLVDGKVLPSLRLLQAALPTLRRDGSVTIVTAASARAAVPGTVALAAANGALEAAVPPLAAELAPLRVNAVSPGVIDTGWWSGLPESERAALFAATAEQVPVGRVGRPEDVADAIVFLAGNGYVTGTVLDCAGGWSLATGR